MNEEINKLEKEITEGLQLIGRIDKAVAQANDKLDELKKEVEVKPVFGGDYYIDWSGGIQEKIGHTRYTEIGALVGDLHPTEESAKVDFNRRKARAYVIEAINKANWNRGGSGFKRGGSVFDNYTYCCEFGNFCSNKTQYLEPLLYVRSDAVNTLSNNEEFKENYKTMLGIN